MKKSLLKLTLGISALAFSANVSGQCPTITCPTNIVVNNDANACGAVVNYTAPIGTDACFTGTGSVTFSYTGAKQIWIVPSGINTINLSVSGAQGGFNNSANGGLGGSATGDLAVSPGDTINIYVGGKGLDGVGGQSCNLTGGFNGGGNTGSICCSNAGGGAGSGGGASDVRIGGLTLADRVIVGAGGGGAGDSQAGANGGGLVGSDGGTYNGVTAAGGTQTAGGIAGGTYYPNHTCSPGTDGALGQGGEGDGNDAGGGGGGYYGGGGGANNGAGAGGSSYIGGVTSSSTTGGTQTGDGEIIIAFTGATPTTSLISGLGSGTLFPVGITTETYTVYNAYGDSSICSFTVTVNNSINNTTNLSNLTITSNETATGATYRWLDCDNNNAVIVGETGISYTATANGNYAVEVTKGCVDTSACVNISTVGINKLSSVNVTLYPNPTSNQITIDFGKHKTALSYTITSIEGKIVKQAQNIISNKVIVDMSNESKGIYTLRVSDDKSSSVYKIIKE